MSLSLVGAFYFRRMIIPIVLIILMFYPFSGAFLLRSIPKGWPQSKWWNTQNAAKGPREARSGPKVLYSSWHLLVPCVEMCPTQDTWSLSCHSWRSSSEPKVKEQPKSSREKRLGELPGAINFKSGVWLILNSSWEANWNRNPKGKICHREPASTKHSSGESGSHIIMLELSLSWKI